LHVGEQIVSGRRLPERNATLIHTPTRAVSGDENLVAPVFDPENHFTVRCLLTSVKRPLHLVTPPTAAVMAIVHGGRFRDHLN
jgi:hypothetical protein